MARAKAAWGIDIGNRALKAIKLVRNGDQLVVDDIDVIEHEQILSNAGDNRESLIQTAVANFVQRHQIKGVPVAVGVSGHASFARFIKLPPVEPKRIPEMIRFEAIQQIPFPLDEVEWSYQIFQTPDSPDVEVGIFAMRKDMVNRQINFFTSTGMSVNAVQTNPLAVYNAMYYDDRLTGGATMIVDVGAENTDLIIADGETVWLRTLPIGGNNFTETLAKSFKVSFAKAEELKRTAATSKFARQIFQAMRPVFADLVSEIQRSIGFYASVHSDSRIKKVYALGGTFRLPTLQKFLQQNLQLEVERLDGFKGGAPADGRAAALLNDNIMSMVGPYGLALQAMGEGKINSSLLPEEIRRERVWKEKTWWFASAAALILLGTASVGAKWYLIDQNYQQAESQRAQNDARDSEANKLVSQWTSKTGPTTVANSITAYNSLAKYHDLWPRILDEISRKLSHNATTSVARPDRHEIVLESIRSFYMPDIEPYLQDRMNDDTFRLSGSALTGNGHGADVRAEQPSGGSQAGAKAAGGPKRGFLLSVVCRSPHAGEVDEAFVKRLVLINASAALNGDPKLPFYIDRATILSKRNYGAASIDTHGGGSSEEMGAGAFSAASTWGQTNTSGATPTTDPEQDPNYDPVTKEDMSKDYQYTVLIAVVLDPTRAPETPGTPQPRGGGR